MKTVLVGEDESSVRELYVEILSEEGYEVLTAKDGRETYRKFRTEKPDLVILDIKMPGMHGFEVLERIRKLDKSVPVIMCTAYQKMQTNTPVSTSDGGYFHISNPDVAAFITKPIDINRLRAEVRRILESKTQNERV